MKRRDVLKVLGTSLLALSATSSMGKLFAQAANDASGAAAVGAGEAFPDVVWVENGEPEQLLIAALKEIGGMSRFISKGDTVVVKPNIGWDRTVEQAANTNPDLVAAIVKECLNAGAAKVRIFDRTCNNPQRCYGNSGIQEKAEALGAEVTHIDNDRFTMIPLKKGQILKEWPIYQDYLDATKVINVPIAKHHGMAKVTLGMKNLMGVMGGTRGDIHNSFADKIVDITSEILPALTIIDAYRILMNHGPQGGTAEDVKLTKTLIMSHCTVAADHAALPLFGLTPDDVEYVKNAAKRGLNKVAIDKMNMKRINL
ncbi:MAG: DUF362 domain-containing protein [Candidatus Riflebacteria bacterium]|nr:DUF362 domain-containing protein [Candidatus Riflebacteria bacterium]